MTDDAHRSTVSALVGELSEISALMLSTDATDRVVWEAAMLAVRATDDVVGCGVTVLRDGGCTSLLPDTAPYARLENFQYEHDAGPVLVAMRESRTIAVEPTDAQGWPAYADLAAELSVASSLVVPLGSGDTVFGALSLYAETSGVLAANRHLGELVADLASTAMSCMARQADQVTLTEELQGALESRAVIEQAKGMLMASGHTAGSAFAALRRASQNRNTKLRDIAALVVELGVAPTG